MGQRPIGVTDEPSGAGVAQIRTRERTVSSEAVVEQYVIPVSERVRACQCMATTFRITGISAANINLASLFNRTGSGRLVAVKRLTVQSDATLNSGTIRNTRVTRITTNPTTGTLLTPVLTDTAESHAALVEFRGANASDGGAATTLTATPGTPGWGQLTQRNPSGTVYEQQRSPDNPLVPSFMSRDPNVLREGEGLLVTNVENASTTTFYIINAVWEEYTLP